MLQEQHPDSDFRRVPEGTENWGMADLKKFLQTGGLPDHASNASTNQSLFPWYVASLLPYTLQRGPHPWLHVCTVECMDQFNWQLPAN